MQRAVRILFFDGYIYVPTLTYSILAHINKMLQLQHNSKQNKQEVKVI